jgi:hypothetical protein
MTALFQPVFTRLALAVLAVAGVSSCTVYEGAGYYGGGYSNGGSYGGGYYGGTSYAGGYYGGGSYTDWDTDYYAYHPPVYRSYVTYSAAWPYYYGGRYYSYRWWNDDRYRNYCHDHGRNYDQYRKRRSSEEIKLVRYRGEDRGRLPTGYHSDQWYKDRGYSLKGNTYRERDGDLRGRRPTSSSRSEDFRRPPSYSRPNDSRPNDSRPNEDRRPSSAHPRALLQPEKYRYTGNGSREANRGSRSPNTREAAPSSRSRGDTRPASDHPRALLQPEKYRYTGGGERGNRSGERRSDNDGRDRKN